AGAQLRVRRGERWGVDWRWAGRDRLKSRSRLSWGAPDWSRRICDRFRAKSRGVPRMRRFWLLAVMALLVAPACGDDDNGASTSASTSTPAQAEGAQQYTVQLDGKTDAFVGEFGSFFPNELTVH